MRIPSKPDQPSDNELVAYLKGEKLYGDDFCSSAVEQWFRDEENAYYKLSRQGGSKGTYTYAYHALNWYHGFRYLTQFRFKRILGIGSAYGEELFPVAERSERITILEPSSGFAVETILGRPVEYVKPRWDGVLPFPDACFDLIVCFGVLHHIANVTRVVSEMTRTLTPLGHMLLREPVISMGDWRRVRKGLTGRERGIPLKVFHQIFGERKLKVCRQAPCMFSLTSRLNYLLKQPVYNSPFWTRLDAVVSRFPIWSQYYHPRFFFHKLRPWCVFFVLQKANDYGHVP